jgi:APA family basic amino acid/polyamine antiporter
MGAAREPVAAASASRRKLGLVALTALVVGNMVGSGVFALPSSLAPYGENSLWAWLVSALGSMCFGLVIARLARRDPAVGGPYAYTRDAFGEFPAFLVGWGYWISCWCAQAAIAVAMVGYLGELVPAAAAHPLTFVLGAILLLGAVNIAGVREAGAVQVVTTVLKLVPLIAIALFGFTRFERGHFEPFDASKEGLPGVMGALALTLWAFQGFESASIAAGDAREPRRDVPRATILGILVATLLYVASTVAVMGLVDPHDLARSNAPFADAARALWGEGAGKVVAAGAAISCFGALNGWTLVAGRMPLAIARDGLFPAFFGHVSRRGTPIVGIALSTLLACGLALANYSGSLAGMFTAITLLATLSALVAFVFSAMAEFHLELRARRRERGRFGITLALLAFGYGLVTILGAGDIYVARGFLLLLAGIPFFVLARARRR